MQKETRDKIIQIGLLVAVVLLFRIIYVDIYYFLQNKFGFALINYVSAFFGNYWVLFLSLGLDILLVFQLGKSMPYGQSSSKRLLVDFISVFAITLLGTVLLNHTILFGEVSSAEEGWMLLFSFLAILLINAIFVIVLDLVMYFRQSRNAIVQEQNKKRKAQYQYQQLKQQLNPHFLFNSLNILDYLVQNEDKQRASDFIKKMASVYRYLLNTGENDLVLLREELGFVEKYTDLLRERFPDGLFMHVDVPNEYLNFRMIPCGLQILVENATKHNIVNKEQPLHIYIGVEKNRIVVRNNLQPRLTEHSTGVGLTNIQKQYKDIAKEDIVIKKQNNEFIVKLPLL